MRRQFNREDMDEKRTLASPAPSAITSGQTPRMNANDVMTIGRKRFSVEPEPFWMGCE